MHHEGREFRPVLGRADTPEKKREIVEALLRAWLDAPSLRLGQLLLVAVPAALFNIEDEVLVKAVEAVSRRVSEARPIENSKEDP